MVALARRLGRDGPPKSVADEAPGNGVITKPRPRKALIREERSSRAGRRWVKGAAEAAAPHGLCGGTGRRGGEANP